VRILVTGASGRVGANLCKVLLESGHDVRAFIYPGDASRMHKLDAYDLDIYQGDLRNYENVVAAVSGMDAVYHVGAAMIGPFENADYFEINARGTFNVIEAVRQTNPGLKRLIYASTDACYPRFLDTEPGQEGVEDMAVNPVGMYAITKWMGERLVLAYHRQYGLPVVAFRFAWVIGAGEILDPNYTRMYWLSKVREQYSGRRGQSDQVDQTADMLDALWPGEERLLISYSSAGIAHSMYYVDVRDLLQGLLLGLTRPEAVGELFNLPGIRPLPCDEVVPHISERIGVPFVEAHFPEPGGYRGLSWEKAHRMLGYTPVHGVESMVDLALAMRQGESIDVIPTGVPYGSA